jgi:hypothetical protein
MNGNIFVDIRSSPASGWYPQSAGGINHFLESESQSLRFSGYNRTGQEAVQLIEQPPHVIFVSFAAGHTFRI